MSRKIGLEIFEVSEKLPEQYCICLVEGDAPKKLPLLAKFEDGIFWRWSWVNGKMNELSGVTYWMICPELNIVRERVFMRVNS